MLAFELTKVVHSEEEAQKALDTALALFSGEADFEHMPATKIDPAKLDDGKIGLLDLLVATGLTQSKGEGRRLVEQGGITLDGEKVEDALLSLIHILRDIHSAGQPGGQGGGLQLAERRQTGPRLPGAGL